ncbi:type III-A CRISPR-associated RAMP protein Csm3 [Bacteroidota bacterium]|nr:type III-A CRISPR-associated RAMP protein Csm3 [Bacteroidota bacterium]
MTKLVKKIEISGIIRLLTGLHIGGPNSSFNIGGIDKNVVRNPLNNQPYIPGSSLKGKLRSLLEIADGTIEERNMGQVNYHVTTNPSHRAVKLFGNAKGGSQVRDQHPSRLIVRDASLKDAEELLRKTEIPYTEGKTEVAIDRITSAANPRQIERVPAGAAFELNLVLNVFDDSDETELINTLFNALKLLRDDYLGGHGSRGYGQIDIIIEQILEKSVDGYYKDSNTPPKVINQKYETEIATLRQGVAFVL